MVNTFRLYTPPNHYPAMPSSSVHPFDDKVRWKLELVQVIVGTTDDETSLVSRLGIDVNNVYGLLLLQTWCVEELPEG
jgi:hypothetical protein